MSDNCFCLPLAGGLVKCCSAADTAGPHTQRPPITARLYSMPPSPLRVAHPTADRRLRPWIETSFLYDWLEEFNGIAGGVLQEDLLGTHTRDHLVAEMRSRVAQPLHCGG